MAVSRSVDGVAAGLALGLTCWLACGGGSRPASAPSAASDEAVGGAASEAKASEGAAREAAASEVAATIEDIALAPANATGLSGLTRDDRGALWSIAEREHVLVEIAAGSQTGAPRRLTLFPIEGVPEGYELESITFMGAASRRRFAVGTEGVCGEDAHHVLLVEVDEQSARVVEKRAISLAPWAVPCEGNHGIEGICRAGDVLVMTLEEAGADSSGRRAAPVAVVRMPADRLAGSPEGIAPFWVALTSDEGKLSGIDCRRVGDTVAVVAVERHFSTARLVAFALPVEPAHDTDGAAPREIEARVVTDLYPHTRGGTRNFEGVAFEVASGAGGSAHPTGALLIVDNHYGEVTGPNELVRVTVDIDIDSARAGP